MEQHPIKINKVQIRNLQIEDYVQLSQSFTRVYSDGSDVFWTREQIQKLIKIFPEGQIVTVVDPLSGDLPCIMPPVPLHLLPFPRFLRRYSVSRLSS